MLALISILFEPLRMALHRLDEAVGGVGGVGGLTNQWNPSASCNTTEGGDNAPYCFHPGVVAGFTPFAGIMMLLCTVPLAVAAMATHLAVSRLPHAKQKDVPLVDQRLHGVNLAAWGVASCLWFLVPLAAYLSSPFYRTDAYHVILAVSITAAFPLSWHMSFVAIPASGAPFLSPLLGLSHAMLKQCHKHAAWATLFWASVHAGGQAVWMTSQGPGDNPQTICIRAHARACIRVYVDAHVHTCTRAHACARTSALSQTLARMFSVRDHTRAHFCKRACTRTCMHKCKVHGGQPCASLH